MDIDRRNKYLAEKKKLKLTQNISDTLEAKELIREKQKRQEVNERNNRLRELRKLRGVSKPTHFYKILDKFLTGITTGELALEYGYSEKEINRMIDQHHEDLSNARAANSLQLQANDGSNPVLDKLSKLELLNQEFLDKLSDNYSPTLTEEEALFCWLYVHKGDSVEAIEESTLDSGLFKDKPKSYKRGVLSRSIYLQNKPNVAQYIKELRESRYYTEDISKQYIQELLLEQIEQTKLRGDRKDSVNLRQLIELLGKTIGAFTERVEVHEIDPSKSLDLLIEMAKDASSGALIEHN